jgi:hypothetical protein
MNDVSSPPTGAKGASWRNLLPIHPAADLFPLMPPDELRALGEDIVKNGLRSHIVLWRSDPKSPTAVLLDGRNRLDAIELVTGKPVEVGAPSLMAGGFLATDRVIVLDKAVEPFTYVISANLHRRHLNAEQRQHLLIELIVRAPGKSDRQIGKEIGVDHKTVASARARGEDVGKIPHVETHTDSRGRKQPARKKHKTQITTKSPSAPSADVQVEAEVEAETKTKELTAEEPPQPIESPTLAQLFEQAISVVDKLHSVANKVDMWPEAAPERERRKSEGDLRNMATRLRGWRDRLELYSGKEEQS